MGFLRDVFGFRPSTESAKPGPAASRRKRSPADEVTRLEARDLPSFFVASATIAPKILPPNGRYLPVTVTGTAQEFSVDSLVNPPKIIFEKVSGRKRASFQVIDEYRKSQTRGQVALVDQGNGLFGFSFTFYLQASRLNSDPDGRQYHVIFGVGDKDGWAGKTFTVLVPHDIKPAPATSGGTGAKSG